MKRPEKSVLFWRANAADAEKPIPSLLPTNPPLTQYWGKADAEIEFAGSVSVSYAERGPWSASSERDKPTEL
jgi:hypothetical protein